MTVIVLEPQPFAIVVVPSPMPLELKPPCPPNIKDFPDRVICHNGKFSKYRHETRITHGHLAVLRLENPGELQSILPTKANGHGFLIYRDYMRDYTKVQEGLMSTVKGSEFKDPLVRLILTVAHSDLGGGSCGESSLAPPNHPAVYLNPNLNKLQVYGFRTLGLWDSQDLGF